jgi:lipopolysaccharide export LptBFGC system permease protein LptF
MVTIGLNLGTYHRYHREFKIPNNLVILIVITNIFSLLFFLGSSIWLDRIWVMVSGILLILLVLVSFAFIFRYSSQKER